MQTLLDIISMHLIGKKISAYKMTLFKNGAENYDKVVKKFESPITRYYLDPKDHFIELDPTVEKIIIHVDSVKAYYDEYEGDSIYVNFTENGEQKTAHLKSITTPLEIHYQ